MEYNPFRPHRVLLILFSQQTPQTSESNFKSDKILHFNPRPQLFGILHTHEEKHHMERITALRLRGNLGRFFSPYCLLVLSPCGVELLRG